MIQKAIEKFFGKNLMANLIFLFLFVFGLFFMFVYIFNYIKKKKYLNLKKKSEYFLFESFTKHKRNSEKITGDWQNRKNFKFIILIILIAVVIPFVINILCNNITSSNLNCGDILSYCGMIFAAILAIFGVHYTIIHDSRPYITLDLDKEVVSYNNFDVFRNKINKTCNQICFIILKNEDVIITNQITEDHVNKIQNSISLYGGDVFYCSVIAKNVGKGCAVNCSISVTDKNCKNRIKNSIPFAINIKEQIIIRIFAIHLYNIMIDYNLLFEYYDICNNVFKVKFPFRINNNGIIMISDANYSIKDIDKNSNK